MPRWTLTSIERFLKYVKKSDDPDGCWLWTGGHYPAGYGKFWNGAGHVGAHCWAYGYFIGANPDELFVCHSCDVKGCVNPAHLWLGTNTENIRDAISKGMMTGRRIGAYASGDSHYSRIQPERMVRGERHGNAKLTTEKVIQMRLRYAQGDVTQQQLANEYNVSLGAINGVLLRKRWQHIE